VWQARQSVQEGARAQALQNFVVDLFENAGTSPAGTPLDVRQLLDAGVRRGSRELARQPQARAELFGVIARLRVGLGDYEQALALRLRQQQIVATLDDVPSSLRLESVTGLGLTRRMLGENQGCADSMRAWQALARREEHQLPVQASEFYSQLGRCERALGETQTAHALFERSLSLRRDPLKNDAGVVENLADLAGLRADGGDSAGAAHELRNALAMLRGKVGERQPLAIDILRNLCTLQRDLGDTDGAERDCRAALALASELQGAEHRATVDARSQLAALLVDEGRYAEAGAQFQSAQAWLVARLGEQHEDVARNYNNLAVVAWERGDLERALGDNAAAIAIARKTRSRQLAGLVFIRALILHSAGRDDEAATVLPESLALRERAGGRPGLLGDTLRLSGEIQAALGHAPLAEQQLERALALTREGYGAAHSHTLRSEISLARLRAAHGDRRALAQLQRIGTRQETDIELRKAVWRARAYAAEADCGGARAAQAQSGLNALSIVVHRAQAEGGVLTREIDALRDACAQAR